MKNNPDPSISAFGAAVLLKHLEALEKEFEGVSTGAADIEYVHRMRVATRRLRAAIPLFAGCLPPKKSVPWLKQIRMITTALGAARDTDVQMEALTAFQVTHPAPTLHPGIERLLLRLRQQRLALQPRVSLALEEFKTSATLPEMQAALQPLVASPETLDPYTAQIYQHASHSILPHLDAFLAFDAIVTQPEKVAELHQMRIAAKHLRYTLENFQTLYNNNLKTWLSAIRGAQDSLGEIHDCDVWSVFLPGFLQDERQRTLEYFGHTDSFRRLEAGIHAFLADRQAGRAAMYLSFNQDWANWTGNQLWETLRSTVQAPLLDPGSLYPLPPSPDDSAMPST